MFTHSRKGEKMHLADFEQEIVDHIYKQMINTNSNYGINLYGGSGNGKTTIALSVAEMLQEDWSTLYIEGINPTLSPYLTWHIGTKLFSKKKLTVGGEISFGIDFLPIPISIELGSAFQKENINYILNPNEEALLEGIKKEAKKNPNILLIADNYEAWDLPSKQFLQKLLLSTFKLLSGFHVVIIVLSQQKINLDTDYLWESIILQDISDSDLLFILRQRGYSNPINIADIRACAGNDLSLALMAADYYNNGNERPRDFKEIMDKRFERFLPGEQEAFKTLQPLTIIDTCFSKDEFVFLIDPSSNNSDETDYLADEYLEFAEENFYIVGKENYRFSSERIKQYLKNQLSKREHYYHKKFSAYLQRRHPEDYYNRGRHIMLSLTSNNTVSILESWQLLLLSYFRRASEVGNMEDNYYILEDIKSLINQLNSGLSISQRQVMQEFIEGFKDFSKCSYSSALLHFQSITPSRLILPTLAECLRLILLCHVQLANTPIYIRTCADELYELIESSDFHEDEEYCRAALILIDVYIDRVNDEQKVKNLKSKIIKKIQNHQDTQIFQEFEACNNRKAALYYVAQIAVKQTYQSIIFYKEHANRTGLYMSLCNHAANAIVAGNYDVAQNALDQCTVLLENYKDWNYQCRYKVENNKALLLYLIKEKRAEGNKNDILIAAREAQKSFKKIMNSQEDEVSYVALLNYLGLSIMTNENTDYIEELSRINQQISEFDEFYQYYIHDLNFAYAILCRDTYMAKNEISLLESISVPLLRNYHLIFQKRRYTQKQMIHEISSIDGDPLKYHTIIAEACAHIQDSSSVFYGRGFLFSDLQFLSL